MDTSPHLSVVIPIRNRERYLREAVCSALDEKKENRILEIIVVNDASTDRSLETIRDLPVRVVSIAEPRGCAHARNVGVAAARGDYVTFLDSDDRMAVGGLWPRYDWLLAHPETAAVAGRIASIIGAEGAYLGSAEDLIYRRKKPLPSPTRLTLSSWIANGKFFLPSWCFVFKRAFLERIGPFDERLEIVIEREMIFRVLRAADIDWLSLGAVHYRWHADNLSLHADPRSNRYVDRPKSVAERFLVDTESAAALA